MEEDNQQQKNSLMSMFSDSAKVNYQRAHAPVEVQSSKPKAPKAVIKSENPETVDENDDSKAEPAESTETDANAVEDETKNDRTLFVGNLPLSMNDKKAITRLFKTYGKIESVRIRSIPLAGAKVDRAGDQDLVKKVCANANQFGDQKHSFNAYVVFETAAAMEAALVENNKLIDTRHIRVDKVNPTLFDPNRSVFIGNLPYRIDEEEVREFFAKALPNGQADIEGIRLIRDPETLLGKGIGYLLLKEQSNVLLALRLHDVRDTVFSHSLLIYLIFYILLNLYRRIFRRNGNYESPVVPEKPRKDRMMRMPGKKGRKTRK
jgi:RNA recognition motif-containing protein